VSTQEDRHRVMELVAQLGTTDEIYVHVESGDPVSKPRPRFARGRAYPDRKAESAEDALGFQLRRGPKFESNVVVACLFYRKSFQRIDVDNLLKFVLDASTKGRMWEDDSQVTALVGVLDLDSANPRTVIGYGRHVSGMLRGESAKVACDACGKLFTPGGQRRAKARWCSRECRMTLAEPVPCAICGKLFKRRSGNQKLCGKECQNENNRRRGRKLRQAPTCHRGHPFDEANTYVASDGRRKCRICGAENARRYRAEKREAAA
jgi:hypothetical protein